jgi:hypothetical protein
MVPVAGAILAPDTVAAGEMIAPEVAMDVANIFVVPVEIVEIAVRAPIAAAVRAVIAVIIDGDMVIRPAEKAMAADAGAEREKRYGGEYDGCCLLHHFLHKMRHHPYLI